MHYRNRRTEARGMPVEARRPYIAITGQIAGPDLPDVRHMRANAPQPRSRTKTIENKTNENKTSGNKTREIRLHYESGAAERMPLNIQPRRDNMPHILVVDD